MTKRNPAEVWGALAEYVRAIEVLQEYGVPLPGNVSRDGNGQIVQNDGVLLAAYTNAHLAEDEALGDCFDAILTLCVELWGGWPEHGETAKWKRLESILRLKNWPDADFLVDAARQSRPIPQAVKP